MWGYKKIKLEVGLYFTQSLLEALVVASCLTISLQVLSALLALPHAWERPHSFHIVTGHSSEASLEHWFSMPCCD